MNYSKEYFTIVNTGEDTLNISVEGVTTWECNLNNSNSWVNGAMEIVSLEPGENVKVKCKLTEGEHFYFMFKGETTCDVQGNIMSLIYGDDFVGKTDLTGYRYVFESLFDSCYQIVNTNNLILPATTLASECYYGMFRGCTSLTTTPELPATTLAEYCYYEMFYGCTSLTTTPELPATTLANRCYYGMLRNCTSLTEAPALPATTLAYECYKYMFSGCKNLTEAPALPATTLASECYYGMFKDCVNINRIVMLATDISARSCLDNWMKNVASSGTFIKHPSMTSLPSGKHGIPDGWTVEDYVNT